jgi:HD-like signal output (HDOD) protein
MTMTTTTTSTTSSTTPTTAEGKKRILFVDDEPAILAALRNLLYKDRSRWEMVFVGGGDDAMSQLRSKAFDVVVSDMRMPGMDGATLLTLIKEEFPATARIMLSGHAEREAIVRALPALHQLLSKPCDAATLRGAIERGFAFAATTTRESEIRAVIGRIDKLPTPPTVYFELSKVMQSPLATLHDVAAIVARDPGLAAKVLQLVNSAYFGSQQTASISAAVSKLGTDQLRYIGLNASVFGQIEKDPFPGFSVERAQERSLRAAALARAMLTGAPREEAFAAALLRDVGTVVLAVGMSEAFSEVIAQARETKRPISDIERELLGVTHAEVGACLLGLWGLPQSLIDVVRYHHDPAGAPAGAREVACAVMVADAFVEGHEIDVAAVERAGFAGKLAAWRAAAEKVSS